MTTPYTTARERAAYLIDLLDTVNREFTALNAELSDAQERLTAEQHIHRDLLTLAENHDISLAGRDVTERFTKALHDNQRAQRAAKDALTLFGADNYRRDKLIHLTEDAVNDLKRRFDNNAPAPTDAYDTPLGRALAGDIIVAPPPLPESGDTHDENANPYVTVHRENRRFYAVHQDELIARSPSFRAVIHTCIDRGVFLEPTEKNLGRVMSFKPENEAEAVWRNTMRQLRPEMASYPPRALNLTSGVNEKGWYLLQEGTIESKHETLTDAVLSLATRNITNVVWSPTFHRRINSVVFDPSVDPDTKRLIRFWQNALHERHGQPKA